VPDKNETSQSYLGVARPGASGCRPQPPRCDAAVARTTAMWRGCSSCGVSARRAVTGPAAAGTRVAPAPARPRGRPSGSRSRTSLTGYAPGYQTILRVNPGRQHLTMLFSHHGAHGRQHGGSGGSAAPPARW